MGRQLVVLALLGLLQGCVSPIDMQQTSRYYLGEAGALNHYTIHRPANWTIQSDARLYIAQGHFLPVGHAYARPNVVAEEAFNAAVNVFPRVRRAARPAGLDEALEEARSHYADFLLYTRFARAQDGLASRVTREQQGSLPVLGNDQAVLQLTLFDVGSGRQLDYAMIEARGGFLQFFRQPPEALLRRPLDDYMQRLIAH